MANPPGVIPPYSNVPAPGSPVRSDWAIQLTNQVVRHGCSLTLGSQSIPANTPADLGWTSESYDTDNYHASNAAQVIIPAGLDGVYLASAIVTASANVSATTIATIDYGAGAVVAAAFMVAGQSTVSVNFSINAAAGQAFKVRVHNGHNAALFYSGRFVVNRVSI